VYLRGVRMKQKLLWEEIQEKKLKLNQLIKDRSSLTTDIIIETSEELDELIKEYYRT